MERAEKEKRSPDFRAHSFPSFKGVSEESASSDAGFQPLFQLSAGNKHSSKITAGDATEGDNGNDPLSVALKESYARGMAAGNKDACSVAQKELEPSLDRFLALINEFSDTYNHISREHSTHIVQLAVAIAEKIVGGSFGQAADTHVKYSEALDELLRRYYQLSLKLNKSDLDRLADLMNCRGKEMTSGSAVQVLNDDKTRPGEPQHSSLGTCLDELQKDPIFNLEGPADRS